MSSKSVRFIALALVLGTAFAALPAHANHDRRGSGISRFVGFGGGWVGVDGIAFQVSDDSGLSFDDEVANPRGIRFRAGMDFNRFLGVELHGAFGRDNSVESFDSIDTSVAAGFVRGSLPLNRFVRFNGLAGVAGVRLSQNIDQFEFDDERSSFALGVSVDVWLGRGTSLTGGWTQYAFEEDGFDAVSAFSLGVRVGFY